MQNNVSTTKKVGSLSTDREPTVTLSKDEINAIINQAVTLAVSKLEALFIAEMKKSTGNERWLSTKAASVVLGKKPDQLRRMVKDGRLRLNKEVRDDRPKNAIKPVYVFNISRCEQQLLTPPEKRRMK